jgi:hypothetical protein
VHGNRSVTTLERIGLLFPNTVYFSERLDFHLHFPSQSQKDRQAREEKRAQWLANAVLAVSNCNIAFLDPDNGLQIPTCSKTSKVKSGKFAYYFEVSELSRNKDVTVIYQHLSRTKKHTNQISTRVAELRQNINPTGTIFALRYRPYSPRAYFIMAAKSQETLLSFTQSAYGKHWDSYYEERPSNGKKKL